MTRQILTGLLAATLAMVAGCARQAPTPSQASPAPASTQFRPVATIQELMTTQVDPSADFIWESVATITSATGVEERQPRTDEDWAELRKHALQLIEATNLLAIEGRHVVREGKEVEDADAPGILKAAEIQKRIDANHAAFAAMAHGLGEAGLEVLAAIDAKNVAGIFAASDDIDAACESCHLVYWYPDAAPRPAE